MKLSNDAGPGGVGGLCDAGGVLATSDDGAVLNAEFAVEVDREQLCLVLESAGGKTSRGVSRNHEYVPALRLLLSRLRDRRAVLESAVVASARALALPERERTILRGPVDLSQVADVERLRLELTTRQGRVGLPAGAVKEGNNRKRIQLRLTVPGYGPQDALRLAADLAGRRRRHWLMLCNPAMWDVWSWWESGEQDLDRWTVGKHLKDIQPGDGFALWIFGAGAGMYGTGTVTSAPYVTTEFDTYWNAPPNEETVVDLRFDRYLFHNPLTKASLTNHPAFAESLIIKMPRYGNPMPLTPEQWEVLRAAGDRSGRVQRPTRSEVLVTSRLLGSVPKEAATSIPARSVVIRYPEAKLVADYQRYLGRELRSLSAVLPTGERLTCDAFDRQERMIIEAKASNNRKDVRMALGQLFDYRHHIDRDAAIAVLLPEQPSISMAELLREHGVKLIYRNGTSFVHV